MNANLLKLKRDYRKSEIQTARISFYSLQPTEDKELDDVGVVSLSHRQLEKQRISSVKRLHIENKSTSQPASVWDKLVENQAE